MNFAKFININFAKLTKHKIAICLQLFNFKIALIINLKYYNLIFLIAKFIV